MSNKTSLKNIESFITKDGSTIRELLHPNTSGAQNQSLAEATVPPGGKTQLHRHRITEEIYHILAGQGCMNLGEQRFDVAPGDSVIITPGTPHCIQNTGRNTLRFLCCCSPAYSHDDTELLADE
jgi:mannose-6-phosphate isomerase-like protein (cupin superfamily)